MPCHVSLLSPFPLPPLPSPLLFSSFPSYYPSFPRPPFLSSSSPLSLALLSPSPPSLPLSLSLFLSPFIFPSWATPSILTYNEMHAISYFSSLFVIVDDLWWREMWSGESYSVLLLSQKPLQVWPPPPCSIKIASFQWPPGNDTLVMKSAASTLSQYRTVSLSPWHWSTKVSD